MKKLIVTIAALLLFSTPAFAAECSGICDRFETIGRLYSDADNPFIQEFRLRGRFHYQLGWVSGDDSTGSNFKYDTDEIRRFRLGFTTKLFNHLTASGAANIFEDEKPIGDGRRFKFLNFWDLFMMLDVNGALGTEAFDSLKIGYGRRELYVMEEFHTSSKKIRTVERSALANKIWPSDEEFSNPTGGWVEAAKGPLSFDVGVFSTSTDDVVADFNDGELYYASMKLNLTEQSGLDTTQLILSNYYQNVGSTDDRLGGGVELASALSLRLEHGPASLAVSTAVGDNGDQSTPDREGTFWGLVVLPTYFIVPEKLEGVFRFHYEGAEEPQGIRINSRYTRRAESAGDATLINGGRGDEHYSLYGGLNYYLCGHHAKVMLGLQYDDIDSSGASVYDGWTTMLAFRTYF